MPTMLTPMTPPPATPQQSRKKTTTMTKSIFNRLRPEKERPVEPEKILRGPLLKPIVPVSEPRSTPAEKMLDWVVNRWNGATLTTRNIMQFGPGGLRDRKTAIATAKILAENGWLHPLPTRQHRGRAWQIIRESIKPTTI